MRICIFFILLVFCFGQSSWAQAVKQNPSKQNPSKQNPGEQPSVQEDPGGLAPEVTDLNAADVSYTAETKLPDLKHPFIDVTPTDRKDGIAVGELGVDGGDKAAVLQFAKEIAAGDHGEIDSFLLYHKDKLIFESYYRRGRVNFPHYQMSITKSYTAMVLGLSLIHI